jgi:aminoacrylate hydrolase
MPSLAEGPLHHRLRRRSPSPCRGGFLVPLVSGLYYELHGPAGAPMVILSTGLGGSGHYWRPNLDALARDHQIVLYDHRGTGRSARELDGPVTVSAWADDLLLLIDELGVPKASVIGHAAGGVAGLALALQAPERLDKLVVVNGWSKADPHFLRCFAARLHLLRDSGVAAYVQAQPIFLYPAGWISRHTVEIDAEAEGHIAHFPALATVESRIAALAAFDIDARLGEIGVPVLALASADDMLVPAFCSERLASGIRSAQCVTMAWGGHACNVTDPDGFAAPVLEFLRS